MTNTPRLSPYEQQSDESRSSLGKEVKSTQYFSPPVETGCEESQRIKILSNEKSPLVIPGDTILVFESKFPGESSGKPLGED
jgi:hypothetical protein